MALLLLMPAVLTVLAQLAITATNSRDVSLVPPLKLTVFIAHRILIALQIIIAMSSTSVFQVLPELMDQFPMVLATPTVHALLVSTAMSSRDALMELQLTLQFLTVHAIPTVHAQLVNTAMNSRDALTELKRTPLFRMELAIPMAAAPPDSTAMSSSAALTVPLRTLQFQTVLATLTALAQLVITAMSSRDASKVLLRPSYSDSFNHR